MIGNTPNGDFMDMDNISPSITIPFGRTLFSPPRKTNLIDQDLNYGEQTESDQALYTHILVDKEQLASYIKTELQDKGQVTLAQVIKKYPLRYGLTELVTYLTLEYDKGNYMINEDIIEPIVWENDEKQSVKANLPRIVYYGSGGDNSGEK